MAKDLFETARIQELEQLVEALNYAQTILKG